MARPTRLEAFIAQERGYYPDEGVNLFAFALGQAGRYDRFLHVILNRYRAYSAEFRRTTEAWIANIREAKDRPPSSSGMLDLTDLTTAIHLEIESFYLFAKIFLDQIARFLEGHFGSQRSLSLDSHDDLTRSFERFKAAKGLVCGDTFQESLATLKLQIADYRDYEIAHAKNPRMVHATTWGPEEGVMIQRSPLYPKTSELERQNQSSLNLFALRQSLDAYIEQVISMIVDNRERSKYLKGVASAAQR